MSGRAKVYLLILWVSTLAACYSPGGIYGRSESALHAVYFNRLNELLDRMDILDLDRFSTQPELDRQRRKYAQGVARNAESMRQTVGGIIERMSALQLTESERQTFPPLAQKLSEQSRLLQDQAQLNYIDALDDIVRQIKMTCSSCHALIRRLPDESGLSSFMPFGYK